MGGVFGGGGRRKAEKRAEKRAREQELRAREMQMISADNQLAAEQERQIETAGPTRRKPRGRRLFADDSSDVSTLA